MFDLPSGGGTLPIRTALALLVAAVGLALAGPSAGAAVSAATQARADGSPATGVDQSTIDAATASVGMVRSAGVIGSSFVAGDDTVVTNFHVARGGTGDIFVDFTDGESVECYTAAANRERDLAVLKCEVGRRTPLEAAPSDPGAGTSVAAIGYPEGVGPTVSYGEITGEERPIHHKRTLQYTAATAPGSSGSPVIDRAGRVVAVVTFGGGYGVPGTDLAPLLAEAEGLPATKAGAEWRLRFERSLIFALVMVAVQSIRLWRRDAPRPMFRALRAVPWAVVIAFALCQIQFMAAGPTLFV